MGSHTNAVFYMVALYFADRGLILGLGTTQEYESAQESDKQKRTSLTIAVMDGDGTRCRRSNMILDLPYMMPTEATYDIAQTVAEDYVAEIRAKIASGELSASRPRRTRAYA